MNNKRLINPKAPVSRVVRVTPHPGEAVTYTLFEQGLTLNQFGVQQGSTRRCYLIATVTLQPKKDGLVLPTGPQENVVATLHHIWTDPLQRRKKHATSVMTALKQHVDIIYAEPLTEDGRKLLEACGFEKNTEIDLYRWVK